MDKLHISRKKTPQTRFLTKKFANIKYLLYLCRKNQTIMEELRNELREIVNKPATKLTKEDKALLSDAAARTGVDATITNPRCGTCWHELAMKIFDAIAEQEQSGAQPQNEEIQKAEPRYVLKKGVDVIFGKVGRVGVRVNELTLTDELGDKLIAEGFPKKYFERCE